MAKKSKSRARLGQNSYGKSRVRILKVTRRGKTHSIRELDVAIALHGDFEAIHCAGDNALCLPTDTMKNTVYALGKDHPIDSIESFALHLARHFVSENRHVSAARVRISETSWKRVKGDRGEHPHCFLKGSEERQTCLVRVDRKSEDVVGELSGLVILKSTDSAFSGYPKTRFTTLPETRDRIFCTSVTAIWPYMSRRVNYERERDAIRRALIATIAAHKSESVQQTLYAMGEAALKASNAIDEIRLSLPNKHCLLVNLTPFGMKNANEVFVPTDEPFGLIEATIERR